MPMENLDNSNATTDADAVSPSHQQSMTLRKRSARKPLRGGARMGSGGPGRGAVSISPSPTTKPLHLDPLPSQPRSLREEDSPSPLTPSVAAAASPSARSSGSGSTSTHEDCASTGATATTTASAAKKKRRRRNAATAAAATAAASSPHTDASLSGTEQGSRRIAPGLSWTSIFALGFAALAAVALTAFAGASAGAKHHVSHQEHISSLPSDKVPQPQQQQQRPTLLAPHVANAAFFHSVPLGDPFEFELDVSGSPSPRVQWRLNGVNLPGETRARLSVDSAQLTHSGTYTCVLENSEGRLVWEEAYLNVEKPAEHAHAAAAAAAAQAAELESDSSSSSGSSDAKARQVRTCLLRRAPEPLMRAARVDGGAALIAAGESAGFLDCFPALQQRLKSGSSEAAAPVTRALDLLRSMHGTSKRRSLLVSVLAAMDEGDAGRAAFETGLYCASTPRCAGNGGNGSGGSGIEEDDDARAKVVAIVLGALRSNA